MPISSVAFSVSPRALRACMFRACVFVNLCGLKGICSESVSLEETRLKELLDFQRLLFTVISLTRFVLEVLRFV